MDISELIKSYKTYDELSVYCGSLFKQVLNLSKKNKELEEKNKELQDKVRVTNNAQVVAEANNSVNLIEPGSGLKVLNDARTIAQVQLKMLKEESFGRELTLEETKKVEIFNRILVEKEEKKEPLKAGAKTLDDAQLLALVNSNG